MSATDPTGQQSVFLCDRGAVTPKSPADVRAEHRSRQQEDEQQKPERMIPDNRAKKEEQKEQEKHITHTQLLELAETSGSFKITEEERKQLNLTAEQVDFIVRYFLVGAAELSRKGLPVKNALLLVAHAGVETSFGEHGPNPQDNNFLSLQPPPALKTELLRRKIPVPYEWRKNRNKEGKLVSKGTPSPEFRDMQQSLEVQIDLAYGLDLPKGLRPLFPSLGSQLRNPDATPRSYGLAAARAGYAGTGTPEANKYSGRLSQQYSLALKVLHAAFRKLQRSGTEQRMPLGEREVFAK